MMLSSLWLTRLFSPDPIKLASDEAPSRAEMKAEAHFNVEDKDWKTFEKSLRGKQFQEAILKHPDADKKLQGYVKNFGAFLRAKDVVAQMPSRSSSGSYKIKKLPWGRLACGCKDWQYVHSIRGTDCDHIKAVKMMKMKAASPLGAAAGVLMARNIQKGKTESTKGNVMKENVMRLRMGMPLLPVR